MFTGTGGLDCSIEGEKIGLASDFLNDADLLGDRAHGLDGAGNGAPAHLGILGGLTRDLFRLGGIVSVLFDVGGHLLH